MIKCNKNFSGVYYFSKRILKFPQKDDTIDDEDIVDLFFGLIELIKKNIEIKVENKYSKLINSLNRQIENYRKLIN